MQFDIDWTYLKPALIVAGLALTVSAAALLFSDDELDNAQRRYNQALSNRNALQQELTAAQHDKLLIDQYQQRYDNLVHIGMVGTEQRLDWVDTLRDSVKALKLQEVRYQLSPQEAYTGDAMAGSEHYTVYVSQLKLELGLLHEIDLLRVLSSFDHSVPGSIHPQHCRLRRMEDIFRYRENRANLKAECVLRWFTLQPQTAESSLEDT